MLSRAPKPVIRSRKRRWIGGMGKTGKHETLQVSGQAGEHVQQETSTGIVNLDPLIGSLEEALSICLQRGGAGAAPRRLEQDDDHPPRCWHQLFCDDFYLPLLRAVSWTRDTRHNIVPGPFPLPCLLGPAAPGEDEFPFQLSSLAAGYCLPLYQPSKFP